MASSGIYFPFEDLRGHVKMSDKMCTPSSVDLSYVSLTLCSTRRGLKDVAPSLHVCVCITGAALRT